jgi:hypothetical protein
MISRTITAADVSFVTGFSRHKLKGLLRELPGFNEPASQARVAKEYSRHDLIVLAVCCQLDEHYGLKRAVIAKLVMSLQQSLLGPRTASTNAYLIVDIPNSSVQYVTKASVLSQGLIFPLSEIFKQVDSYLEHGTSMPLDLAPVVIPTSSKTKGVVKPSSVFPIGDNKKRSGGAKQ